jgi:putative two-component system response regulator
MQDFDELPDAALNDIPPEVGAIRTLFGNPRPYVDPVLGNSSPDQVIQNPKIAIVDDQPINIKVVQKYLKLAGYQQFATTTDSREALQLIDRERPDVLLLDIMMPHVSGLEILSSLREDSRFTDLPVIILTADTEKNTKLEALKRGTTEFLNKPVDSVELQTRLRNVLVAKARHDALQKYAWELELEVAIRCTELAEAYREVVHCLATLSEYRDNETGKHIIRVGKYAEIIAKYMGMDPEFVGRISDAAPLHDVGKIGIPDDVLLKPGKLDQAERGLMNQHCDLGRSVCHEGGRAPLSHHRSHVQLGRTVGMTTNSPLLQMAGSIAFSHHERWDGAGYPQGLRGENIPIEGRITALADVFDALTSKRPYKPAFSVEKSMEIIREQRGKHFDPQVLDAFLAGFDEIMGVYHEFRDSEESQEETAIPGGGGNNV